MIHRAGQKLLRLGLIHFDSIHVTRMITSRHPLCTTNMATAGDEWPSLASLPINSAWEIGSTSTAIRTAVNRQQSKELTTAAPYVVFSNVPPLLVDESNDRPSLVGRRSSRADAVEEFRPSCYAQDELLPTGSKRIKSASRSKDPDASWRPRSLPVGRSGQWPTVVIEGGCSESLSRLRLDAQWWMTSFAVL